MKKIYFGGIGIMVVIVVAFGAYFFLSSGDDYGPVRPPKDLSGIIVQPVQVPMKGKTFTVPEQDGVSVVLDLVSPTAKRDYPMGKFTASDGVAGTMYALDDFTSAYENNRRVVPIAVKSGTPDSRYFLAVLEGDDMRHATSVPIANNIKITSITRTGDHVSVNYLVHARGQVIDAVPEVSTTAIFDIATGATIQLGRNPATEEEVIVKNLAGTYRWKETVYEDKTLVPSMPDVFTLTFDANRISLETDCNTGGAEFTLGSGSSTDFTVGEIATTKMFCESAEEGPYFEMFTHIVSYSEASNGTIVFMLKEPAGAMTFVPVKPLLEFEATSTTVSTTDAE